MLVHTTSNTDAHLCMPAIIHVHTSNSDDTAAHTTSNNHRNDTHMCSPVNDTPAHHISNNTHLYTAAMAHLCTPVTHLHTMPATMTPAAYNTSGVRLCVTVVVT